MAHLTVLFLPSRKQETFTLEENSPVGNLLNEYLHKGEETSPSSEYIAALEQYVIQNNTVWSPIDNTIKLLQKKLPEVARGCRLACKIVSQHGSLLGKASSNPLENQNYVPVKCQLEMQAYFPLIPANPEQGFLEERRCRETAVIILGNLVDRAVLAIVGFLVITPTEEMYAGGETGTLSTVAGNKATLIWSRKKDPVTHTLQYKGKLTIAHLSDQWRLFAERSAFYYPEEGYHEFNGEGDENVDEPVQEMIDDVALDIIEPTHKRARLEQQPTREIIQGNLTQEEVYDLILHEIHQVFQQLQPSLSKESPTLFTESSTWLDIPALVEKYWNNAYLKGDRVLYYNSLGSASGLPYEGSLPEIFPALITFGIYIYPYQFWSSCNLLSFGFAFLPTRLKQLAFELEHKLENQYSLCFSSWTAMIVHLFVEQVVMPTIKDSLKKCLLLLDSATENDESALFAGKYRDIQPRIFKEFATALFIQFGIYKNKAQSNWSFNEQVEALSKMLTSHTANHSLSPALNMSSISNERPFADSLLYRLKGYFPSVVLERFSKDGKDNAGEAAATGDLMQLIAGNMKRTEFSFSPKALGGVASSAAPVPASVNPHLIMDIEDLGESTAPPCMKAIIRSYKDTGASFGLGERQSLNSSLIGAFAYLKGLTKDGKTYGPVINKEYRASVIEGVRSWYEYYNPDRFAYIRESKECNGHDFGPNLHRSLISYTKEVDGESYAKPCMCSPAATAKGKSDVMPYLCPLLPKKGAKSNLHSSYTAEEKKTALAKCQVMCEGQEGGGNGGEAKPTAPAGRFTSPNGTVYIRKPFEWWIAGAVTRWRERRRNRIEAAIARPVEQQ